MSTGRAHFVVRGVVQGVGFRPFVYALARAHGLSGWVNNSADGVHVEVEGAVADLDSFEIGLRTRAPTLALVESVERAAVPVRGGTEFVIENSTGGAARTLVSPDVATCPDCLAELADPADRRHRHPFISCTNCGPRFTVILDLPYDRPATTMASLPLCEACAAEYADPADRRFHAQTVACPDCGPTLRLVVPGSAEATGNAAVAATRSLLAAGAVVAIKGLGGYHLACDAGNADAVATLRKRKDRGDKPFAVMVGSVDTARQLADVDDLAAGILASPRRPCVLLPKRDGGGVAEEVAPGSPELGILLAYTPVHHLLFGLPGDPAGPSALVMTSGNVSGEPIVTDDADALARLAALADAWLGHDRAIVVPCDDSVVRVADGAELPVRRSRGYAPLPVALPLSLRPALAVGGDLKNTFCVAQDRYAWMSAHVGDMDDLATLTAFEHATGHLAALTGVRPEVVVADRHPGYRSAGWAWRCGLEVATVQHHHAHIAAALADNAVPPGEAVIGFAFDGTGYGDDGAVWGGEVLVADYVGYQRAGHLRYVAMPGGDAAVQNPYRMALSHLRSAGVEWDPRLPCVTASNADELRVLARQLATGFTCLPTSSMGRLFDAVSSIAGVCHRTRYEAEAAMRFEGLARGVAAEDRYAFALDDDLVADPGPVIAAVAADVVAGVPTPVVAEAFHGAVVRLVVEIADEVRARTGIGRVALSGGVFLNVLLTTGCGAALARAGFEVLRHRHVPPSDAGLALGQIVVGAAKSG
jgi:hydrogenase maturation protein HypF